MSEVCIKYGIPRSSFREHYARKKKSRKIGHKGSLTMVEEEELVKNFENMVRISCSLNTAQLKLKVAKITQDRMPLFTNGMPRKSLVK